MITCGKCHRAITGEAKKIKKRIYVYYHCANPGCDERRRNIPEQHLMTLITEAFTPFQRFTPEHTKTFLETMSSKLEDLDYYTQREVGKLAEKRLALKKKFDEADRLLAAGKLSQEEYKAVIEIRSAAMIDLENELHAYTTVDVKTFLRGRKIIETFHKAYNFMSLGSDNLKKAELARIVLSKLSWSGGTLQFEYRNPFDVLLEITGVPGWWRWRESNPRPRVRRKRRLHA
jgi:hypothetical protein